MAEEPKREEPKREKSARWKRRQERIKRARGTIIRQRVRVTPRDDDVRKSIRHPTAGGFRAEGSIDWPLDSFTKRRIREGAVTVEKVDRSEHVEHAERHRGGARHATSAESTS